MLPAGIGTAYVITFDVSELTLDRVGMPLAALVEQARCRRTEAVRSNFILAVAKPAQSSIERALGNRSFARSNAGKQQIAALGYLAKPLENSYSLCR